MNLYGKKGCTKWCKGPDIVIKQIIDFIKFSDCTVLTYLQLFKIVLRSMLSK